MNLVQFLENRYQELTYETKDAFNLVKDAETKAAHSILNSYRTVLKWLLIPKLFIHYIAVKLHLTAAPEPILLRKLQEQKLAAEKAAKEKADAAQEAQSQTAPSSSNPVV